MSIVRNLARAFGLVASALLCASSLAADNPLLDKYRADGATVGIAGYAPYGYKQPDGSFTGEQVEIVKYVLKQMGVTDLRFVAMDFGALIPSLVAGRVDLAAAGIYVRPKRCEQVLFAVSGETKDPKTFRILFLDRKNVLIADEAQAKGTVDHVPVYPREVAKRALELNASALILVHNHPSGDPTPSEQDIAVTHQVAAACDALGLTLHDHLIIGKSAELSFRSEGYL